MSRLRNRDKRSWLSRLTAGLVIMGIISWGAWQTVRLTQSVLADGQPPENVTTTAAATSTAPAVLEVERVDRVFAGPLMEEAAEMEEEGDNGALSAEEIAALIENGRKAFNAGRIASGRDLLSKALLATADEAVAETLRGQLIPINMPVFFGTDTLADDEVARFVPIQSGDTYAKIAKRHGITSGLLETMNPSLNPRNLKITSGIKIVEGPFHATVSKNARRLDLFAGDVFVTTMPLTMDETFMLPSGTYRVKAGGKIAVMSGKTMQRWIGFERFNSKSGEIAGGETYWFFATPGSRERSVDGRSAGAKVRDDDLVRLYNTLTEGRSLVRVRP